LVSSSGALTEATLQNMGISIKSKLAVLEELSTGKLVEIMPQSLADDDVPISTVRSPNLKVSRKVDTFLAFVETCFQDTD